MEVLINLLQFETTYSKELLQTAMGSSQSLSYDLSLLVHNSWDEMDYELASGKKLTHISRLT